MFKYWNKIRTLILIIAGIILLVSFFFPIWKIYLNANMYPNDIGMAIYAYKPGDPPDVKEIDGGLAELNGFIFAYFYAFYLGAPLLRVTLTGWSILYPPYPLPPILDLTKMMALLLLTVIPYIAVGIVPVWKSSIVDPEVVFRT